MQFYAEHPNSSAIEKIFFLEEQVSVKINDGDGDDDGKINEQVVKVVCNRYVYIFVCACLTMFNSWRHDYST